MMHNAYSKCLAGAKTGRLEAKSASKGVHGNTLPKPPIRCYHYTREVATHKNPERTKDEHSAGADQPRQARGQKQAPIRRPVQRSR